MFLFQNGLMATFIPDIIMVLAYFICLFGPVNSIQSDNIDEIEPKIVQADFNSVLTIQTLELLFILPHEKCEQETNISPHAISKTFALYNLFCLDDCLSFTQFSRPPPSLLI